MSFYQYSYGSKIGLPLLTRSSKFDLKAQKSNCPKSLVKAMVKPPWVIYSKLFFFKYSMEKYDISFFVLHFSGCFYLFRYCLMGILTSWPCVWSSSNCPGAYQLTFSDLLNRIDVIWCFLWNLLDLWIFFCLWYRI